MATIKVKMADRYLNRVPDIDTLKREVYDLTQKWLESQDADEDELEEMVGKELRAKTHTLFKLEPKIEATLINDEAYTITGLGRYLREDLGL